MSRRTLERVGPGMTISCKDTKSVIYCSQISSEDRTKESFSGGTARKTTMRLVRGRREGCLPAAVQGGGAEKRHQGPLW